MRDNCDAWRSWTKEWGKFETKDLGKSVEPIRRSGRAFAPPQPKGPNGYFRHLATNTVQAAAASEIMVRSFSDLNEARTWLRDIEVPTT
ncbi:MAG TPA: hypothetical protein VHD59_14195 [Pseudolabrys sp.]|jgi:hypothetical protein|nr:hypothetical protein [Pseudolabrys sp.]